MMERLDRSTRAITEIKKISPTSLNTKILDVGCGFGETLALLAREGYQVTGVDISADAITKAKAAAPEATLLQASADKLPLCDGDFDAVIALDVLEHLPNGGAAVDEMLRVLKSGGLLIVTVPYAGWSRFLDPANLKALLAGQNPSHKHYSVREIVKLLGNNFTIQSVEKRGLGISQVLQIFSNPIRRCWLKGRQRIKQKLSAIESWEYNLETGPLAYHLFLSAKKS